MNRRRAVTLLMAAAMDAALGEPSSRYHPVAWLGGAAGALERCAPENGPRRQMLWGAAVAAGIPTIAALAGHLAERGTRRRGVTGIVADATLLKSAFAVRALLAASEHVRRCLEAGRESEARTALRALVSRDATSLTPTLIAAAAIESLAENATDSFVAPWLAYAVAGLPGAFAYRAVNTLDSMIGYRGRYEYLGKAAARLDDLVNLVPARLTAALLALSSPVGTGDVSGAVRAIVRDRRRTVSPNAGWTMAAMAGGLGVSLEKAGAYVLGDGRPPRAGDIRRAQRIVAATAGLGLAAAGGVAVAVKRPARGRRGR